MQEDGTLASLKKKWWNENRIGGSCDVSLMNPLPTY